MSDNHTTESKNGNSNNNKTNKKKDNSALAAYERLQERLEALETQRHMLDVKLQNQKRKVKQAQLVESYMVEETRAKDDEYRSLNDELKHRNQSNKAFHSQIARLERQVADLHYEMGVGQHVGTTKTVSMAEMLPEAISFGLDQALRGIDAVDQTEFTRLKTAEARLSVIKGNNNALDRPRVTILVKNVDPSARGQSAQGLQRTFIATAGLTFQDVLEDSLRFWNMLPEEDEVTGSANTHATNATNATNATSVAESEASASDATTNATENVVQNNKLRFCLADEGGALRFGHMLVSKDIPAADVTKDNLILSYLLFSLPELKLIKVQEFSDDLNAGGFEKKNSGAVESDKLDSGQGSNDDLKENEDEEKQMTYFRYDAVLTDTPLLVKDLVFFVFWLLLWIMVSHIQRNVSYDNQVATLSKHWLANRKWDGETQDRWVDFESMTTAAEWWAWAQGPMSLTMSRSQGMSQALDFGGSKEGLEGGNAGGTFVLYGGWRLRQARVPPDCLDSLSSSIEGKSIKNDPNKKLESFYGTYGQLLCYSKTPFGPLNNNTESTILPVTHFTETMIGNKTTYTTTTEEHTIARMTKTPDQSTIALKYNSFNPFQDVIVPAVTDLDTIAWLKAFLYYPSPTTLQEFLNSRRGPYKDYRNPDYFDTSPKNGLISNYGGSGFVLELPANLSSASFSYRLQKLKEHNWIDKQTRAIIARANFFNVNSGQWAVVDALAEWDQSGKMKTMFKATPVATDQYATALGKLSGLLGFLVTAGALYFLFQQIRYWKVVRQHLRADKRMETIQYMETATCPVTMTWLSSVWTIIELGVLIPCLTARVLDLSLFIHSKRQFPVCQWFFWLFLLLFYWLLLLLSLSLSLSLSFCSFLFSLLLPLLLRVIFLTFYSLFSPE